MNKFDTSNMMRRRLDVKCVKWVGNLKSAIEGLVNDGGQGCWQTLAVRDCSVE